MSGEERSTIRAKPARDCTLRPDAHVNELSKLTVEEATASISHFLGTKSLWLEVFWNGSIWFQSSYEGPILSIFHSPRAAIGWDVDRNMGTRLQEYGCKCTIQCIQGFHSGCEVNSGYFAVLTKVSNHLLRERKGFACISSRTSIGKHKVNLSCQKIHFPFHSKSSKYGSISMTPLIAGVIPAICISSRTSMAKRNVAR